MPCRVDAFPVDARPLYEVIKHGHCEADVINVVPLGITTAGAAIERQQPIRKNTRAVRIHHDETLAIGEGVKPRIILEALRLSTSAMVRNKHRERTRTLRHMGYVGSGAPLMTDRKSMIARA